MARACGAFALILTMQVVCAGQTQTPRTIPADYRIQLPTSPAQWVNSGPISVEALAGKAAVLLFYEESCPSCREIWPSHLEKAKRFEGQPVIFIAVNSGNSRADVEQYARGVGCTWPVIVDESRELEKRANIGEISLQNVLQACYINSEGQFKYGRWNDLEGTAANALQGAKWKVDPASVPATLYTAWMAVEFGNPGPAGAAIKKALASPKTDIKEAATKLNDVVQADIQKLVQQAKEAEGSGNKWQSYKNYQTLITQYGGYDLPSDIKTKLKELSSDDGVKKQLLAQKSLESIVRLLHSPSATTRKSGVSRLKKLVEEFGGTDAAQDGQQLLTSLAGQD